MNRLSSQIKDQFEFNARKNLFCTRSACQFAPATRNFLDANRAFLQNISCKEKESLADALTEQSTEIFYQTNQYFSFSRNDCADLKEIYLRLFDRLRDHSHLSTSWTWRQEERTHYENLKNWLKKSNSFAEKIYGKEKPYIAKNVLCAEYSPQMQMEFLHIDLNKLKEPILDIGCGKHALLVNWLKEKGLDAYGIDRMAIPGTSILKVDWFEWDLKPHSWGTVLSNLGVSNQFRHHHLRNDGNPNKYARKYLEILNSLMLDGTFIYAPDLPFIEPYLDSKLFQITNQSIADLPYRSTSIQRKRFSSL